jgi:hypothetical protein
MKCTVTLPFPARLNGAFVRSGHLDTATEASEKFFSRADWRTEMIA